MPYPDYGLFANTTPAGFASSTGAGTLFAPNAITAGNFNPNAAGGNGGGIGGLLTGLLGSLGSGSSGAATPETYEFRDPIKAAEDFTQQNARRDLEMPVRDNYRGLVPAAGASGHSGLSTTARPDRNSFQPTQLFGPALGFGQQQAQQPHSVSPQALGSAGVFSDPTVMSFLYNSLFGGQR